MTQITFCGGAQEVTGANYLIEESGKKILIDCGLIHERDFCGARNYADFSYHPEEIDAVLITHAHMDHAGRLPKLYRDGFRGEIYATPPTRDLIEIMLSDSVDLIGREARRTNRQPLYERTDVDRVMDLFKGVSYRERISLGKDISFIFRDAGHILGSSLIEFFIGGKKIIFSGDLGNPPTPLLCPTEFIQKADYCIVESAYGDRIHEDSEKRKNKLEDIIEDTIARRGTLMIPAFALERTQEILFELNDLVEHHRIPRVPVFIDSPLAIQATEIYKKYSDYFNAQAQYIIRSGDDLFQFPGIHFTERREDSDAIADEPPPKIIIAGSGMSAGGRIVRHEKHYLPDARNTLLFIGYQGAGSLGRRLFEGAKEAIIERKKISVRARIEAIGGYSAHADQKKLLEWIGPMRLSLRDIFVVQGEMPAAQALAQKLRDTFSISVKVPEQGEKILLS